MNINFAKTFGCLATRILSKIAARTMIQYLNLFVFTRNMEIIIKEGQEIKRYVPSEEQQSSGKKVKKIGIAYDLEN
ncbi:hypothetical protein EZS27_042925, partial [termite gut metagenome]